MYLLPEYSEKQLRIKAAQETLEGVDGDESSAERAEVEAELTELLG
jgi:hypothetical protein